MYDTKEHVDISIYKLEINISLGATKTDPDLVNWSPFYKINKLQVKH